MTGFALAVVPPPADPDDPDDPDELADEVLLVPEEEPELDEPLEPEEEEDDDDVLLLDVLADFAVPLDDDPTFFLAEDLELLLPVVPPDWPPVPDPLPPASVLDDPDPDP
jgi:hypothetical protein